MSIQKFYKKITGYQPYTYQKKAADLLLNNKNIVLSVPTGAGKTWASIMPFLYAQRDKRIQFPEKLIYSLLNTKCPVQNHHTKHYHEKRVCNF